MSSIVSSPVAPVASHFEGPWDGGHWIPDWYRLVPAISPANQKELRDTLSAIIEPLSTLAREGDLGAASLVLLFASQRALLTNA
jgi:hypothetical protein